MKAEALGFADALNTDEAHDIMVGAEGFDASDVDPVRLRQVRQAWLSLIPPTKERLETWSKVKSRLVEPGGFSTNTIAQAASRRSIAWQRNSTP